MLGGITGHLKGLHTKDSQALVAAIAPVDLTALTKNPRYAPDLLEGDEMLDFSLNILDDAVT